MARRKVEKEPSDGRTPGLSLVSFSPAGLWLAGGQVPGSLSAPLSLSVAGAGRPGWLSVNLKIFTLKLRAEAGAAWAGPVLTGKETCDWARGLAGPVSRSPVSSLPLSHQRHQTWTWDHGLGVSKKKT